MQKPPICLQASQAEIDESKKLMLSKQDPKPLQLANDQ